MKRTALIAVAVVAGGCGDGRQRITRGRDAGPVVVVAPVAPVGPRAGTTTAALPGVPAPTAVATEREPNPDVVSATVVSVGGAGRGSLDGSADVDVFRVDVPTATTLLVTLPGIVGSDLVLEQIDANGKVVAGSDRGPAGTAEGLPNLPVAAGTVWLRVREFVKPPARKPDKKRKATPPPTAARVGPSADYQLGVWDLAAPSLAARRTGDAEPNGDVGTAGELALGESGLGYLGWGGDVDTWKVSLEALTPDNALDVSVSGVAGVALTIDVRDAAGQVLVTRKGSKGAAVHVPGLALRRAGAAPFAHVQVRGDRSNPEATYELRLVARALGADEEREPDDSTAAAMPLAVPGPLQAQTSSGDVDRFALEIGADPRRVLVTLPALADVTWRLRLIAGSTAVADQRGAAGGAVSAEATLGGSVEAVVEAVVKGDGVVPYELRWELLDAADALPPEVPAGDAPTSVP